MAILGRSGRPPDAVRIRLFGSKTQKIVLDLEQMNLPKVLMKVARLVVEYSDVGRFGMERRERWKIDREVCEEVLKRKRRREEERMGGREFIDFQEDGKRRRRGHQPSKRVFVQAAASLG